MNTTKLLAFSVLLALSTCTDSCEYLPDLESENCIDVTIKGSVYVKPSGEKLNNKPVKVHFNGGMFGEFTYKVASGKTDKNGEFNFKAPIDTTHFRGSYSLHVSVSELNKEYISELPLKDGTIDIRFFHFDSDTLQNIKFELYNKAILTIDVKRVQSDDTYLYVEYLYGTFWKQAFYPTRTEGVFQCETAADVFTKVRWKIRLNSDYTILEEGIDSLICKQNNNNVININY